MNRLNLRISFYYILLLGVHMGLVWLLPYFPTQDGPSHVYNLVILKDLLNGGREWGSFFTYQLRAVPNLAFPLLSYPLLKFFSPLAVEKLFISIYIALMGIGTYFFLDTFNKTSLFFIFFLFPLIFNFNLLMGFYSYVLTIPLFFIAFSFCWRNRSRSTAFKFLFFNLFGFVLFYFHMIPFVFFLISLIVITIVYSKGYKKDIFDLLKLSFILSPSFLIMFLYLIKGPITYFSDLSYLLSPSRFTYLKNDLVFFSTVTFSPWQMFPAYIFMFLFLSFLILTFFLSIKDRYKRKIKIGDLLYSKKVLICLSLILILIYLITPFKFGGGAFFNQRFPWVIFLIILPLLRIDEKFISKRFVLISGALITCLFLIVNIIVFWQQGAKIQKFLSGLNAGIPNGAFVMTYNKWDPKPHWPRIDVLMHAASYYGIFNGCVDIGNYETDFDYFSIHFKNTIPRFPSPDQIGYKAETIDWSDYPSVQYLLGWEVNKDDNEKLSKYFHVIYKNAPFSLWKRNQSKSSALAPPIH